MDKVQHRVFLISNNKVDRNDLGLRPRLIKSSIKYYELIRMIHRVYYLLSINYDFLMFRTLWLLRISIENVYETQLGLRPRHESQYNATR